jgi:DNA-binding NarL/FixJ family response regulator
MPADKHQGKVRILIARGDFSLAGQFTAMLDEVFELSFSTTRARTFESIKLYRPDLVLLDPLLFPGTINVTLPTLTDSSPRTRIMVIENQTHRSVDQYALFKAGAHGFCMEDISPALLDRAVKLVCEGEFWIQRKLIAQVISEQARKGDALSYDPAHPRSKAVQSLTPRELEVARMVHLGGNNKMIARELEISERTVKAHLSAIFRKLEIENRLHLALFFNDIN